MIISWTCDDEPADLLSSRIHVTEAGKLRISSAKPGDACNYRCEAADGFGTLSVVIKVIIVDKRSMEQLGRRRLSPPSEPKSGASRHLAHSPVERQPELDIRLQPNQLEVAKNQSFSLECTVRHAQHLGAPQIIWLKQFAGPEPKSLGEAHEQNLVKIDDLYYHSLNWPRSMSYSKHQSGANSALLVRQSSHVHSGRYICFAGYPPASLLGNAALSGLASHSPKSNASNNVPARRRPWYSPPAGALYNLSVASVLVREPDSSSQPWPSDQHGRVDAGLPGSLAAKQQLKELLFNLVANNSWIRDASLGLLLISSCLYVTKSIYVRLVGRRAPRAQASTQAAHADGGQEQSSTNSTNNTTAAANHLNLNQQPQNNYSSATKASQANIILQAQEGAAPNLAIKTAFNNPQLRPAPFGRQGSELSTTVNNHLPDSTSVPSLLRNPAAANSYTVDTYRKLTSSAWTSAMAAPLPSAPRKPPEAPRLPPHSDHPYSEIGQQRAAHVTRTSARSTANDSLPLLPGLRYPSLTKSTGSQAGISAASPMVRLSASSCLSANATASTPSEKTNQGSSPYKVPVAQTGNSNKKL